MEKVPSHPHTIADLKKAKKVSFRSLTAVKFLLNSLN